jgi:predicted patatin/cPLA2 family phospholipase
MVGVSAGIANGISYISKQHGRNLEVVTTYAADRRYMGVGNLLNRKNRSYFGLEFVYERIPNELVPFDYETYAAFPGTVEAVVTNLNTGKAEYLPLDRVDRQATLVQASCAMPLMFPIYHIGGQPYLDGGAADGIPWKRALDQGCDRVLVVLSHARDYVRKPDKLMGMIRHKYKAYPEFVRTMEQRAERYNRCMAELFEAERQGKVMVLAPVSTLGVSRVERDTEKLRLLWGAGYQAAMERMDEIRAFFGEG